MNSSRLKPSPGYSTHLPPTCLAGVVAGQGVGTLGALTQTRAQASRHLAVFVDLPQLIGRWLVIDGTLIVNQNVQS